MNLEVEGRKGIKTRDIASFLKEFVFYYNHKNLFTGSILNPIEYDIE